MQLAVNAAAIMVNNKAAANYNNISSPLPAVVSLLPSLLSPSFVFLAPQLLSQPVHLRHRYLRPGPDSPAYLQATNDEIVQGAVEGRRERLVSGRWAHELELAQGQQVHEVQWNAALADEDGVRARVVLGELPEERLALVLVWEQPQQQEQQDLADSDDEPGWRYYDLQLPASKEAWYPSLEAALSASGRTQAQHPSASDDGQHRRLSPENLKKLKKKKRRKPQTPQDTGLQGEEGPEADPDDYWAGCSSSSAASGSTAPGEHEEEDDDGYWASYGQPVNGNDAHGPGSIDDDGRDEQHEHGQSRDPYTQGRDRDNTAAAASGQAGIGAGASDYWGSHWDAEAEAEADPERDRTALHSRKPSAVPAASLACAYNGTQDHEQGERASYLGRNVSFMSEPGLGTAVADDSREGRAYDQQQSERAAAAEVNGSRPRHEGDGSSSFGHQDAHRAMSFMDEQGGAGPGSSFSARASEYGYSAAGPGAGERERYSGAAAAEAEEDDVQSSYNYRGFYEYPSAPSRSRSRAGSPTHKVMNGVSSALEGAQREAALKSAIRGVWGLYQMSRGKSLGQEEGSSSRRRSRTVTSKDPRIEQYEFLELVRSVVEGVEDDD